MMAAAAMAAVLVTAPSGHAGPPDPTPGPEASPAPDLDPAPADSRAPADNAGEDERAGQRRRAVDGETIELSGAVPDRDTVHPDAARGLDDPAFVTVVRVDEAAGETTSVAELLSESVGVRVRSAGGLGSFSSLSVRGADAGQTTVLVDGVPLSRLASVGVDLGRFDVGAVSEIELYRGATPVGFGGATLGGALNLVTRTGGRGSGNGLSGSIGAGSFGSRHARVRWLGEGAGGAGGGSDDRGYHLSLSYAGAEGDFAYFDDRGTSVNRDDDEVTRRRNNHYDQVHAVARVRGRRGEVAYHAGVRSAWKQQGVPGTSSAQSTSSELGSMLHMADVGAHAAELWGRRGLDGEGSLYGVFERQRYRDLEGEIGVGVQDRRYLSGSLGGRALAGQALGIGHRVELGADARLDLHEDRDLDAPDALPGASRGARAALAGTLEYAWAPAAGVLVRPGVRVDWLRTWPVVDRNRPGAEAEGRAARTDVMASPRVSARVGLGRGLAVKASVGRYLRAPTLLELFGDRGFTVGNPGLRSETGVAGDLGLVLAPLERWGVFDRVYVEAVGFGRASRDTIVFSGAGGPGATALNLGETRALGGEFGAAARLGGFVRLRGNYTYLRAWQRSPLVSYDGKPLPQRPRHQVYGRVDVEGRALDRSGGVFVDLGVATTSYADAAGLSPVPARRLLGAGVRLELGPGWVLAVEGKNLTDARIEQVTLDPAPQPDLAHAPRAIADLAGFPLPGRSVYVSLAWQP
ncbi:TonB-dependent receptor plug domain-containing protein [Haliangium sp.]